MVDYKGSKCIVCGNEFKDGDDIVVCPECGTPYHRDCYNENGKCINSSLHETGGSWKPDNAPAQHTGRICIRCRQENPENALYCCRCGLPFNAARNYADGQNDGGPFRENIDSAPLRNDTAPPNAEDFFAAFTINYSDPLCGFNPAEEYENGVKLAELGAFVDTNTHYYLPKFKFMKETGTGFVLNFTALFFPQFYFAYRKMPLMALVSALILFVAGIPQTLLLVSEMGIGGVIGGIAAMFDMKGSSFRTLMMLCSAIGSVYKIYASFNANRIYFRHCLKKIPAIKSKIPENVTLAALHHEGGTSAGLLILFISLYFIESMALTILSMNI